MAVVEMKLNSERTKIGTGKDKSYIMHFGYYLSNDGDRSSNFTYSFKIIDQETLI